MAEWWIEALKQRAQKAMAFEGALEPKLDAVDCSHLLNLIELATKFPPPDALEQCQVREAALKEELDDEQHESFDLRHENDYLTDRIDELEQEIKNLEADVERLMLTVKRSDRA